MRLRVPSSETISGELENNTEDPNRPHPKRMKCTEGPLSTIPRDMHETMADRLIDAISNSFLTILTVG